MGAGYTRQSAAAIADGNTITALDLENEFDAIQDAFHASTGHTHDGTIGEGPKISLTTSISGVLPVVNGGVAGINKVDATLPPTINEDSGDGYAVGSLWMDTTNDVTYICIDSTPGNAVWQRHQLYDTDLQALANLTSAANKLPYATGAGTWAMADLSPTARTLLDDADVATMRTTLGLVIGTNVQAQDAELSAIAGLTSAANKGIQFTGAGAAATYDLTVAGKALLDDADASAQLTTLGVSAYAKTLLDDADSATARATLQIGSFYQPLDNTLTALAGINTTAGFVVQTATDVFAQRTMTGTANEVTVTNGNGASGNPTFSLPSALSFTGKTITGGTYVAPSVSTDLAVKGKIKLGRQDGVAEWAMLDFYAGTVVVDYDARIYATVGTGVMGGGTLAVHAANWQFGSTNVTGSNFNITGGTISGITDLAIADGGTGASTAADAFTNLKQAATETATGVVELATVAETSAGTDTVRAVTPAGVKAVIDTIPTPNYGDGNASLAANAIGQMAFCITSAAVNFGNSTSGSNLKPTAVDAAGTVDAGTTARSGSWRCLGHATASGRATLFIRIA